MAKTTKTSENKLFYGDNLEVLRKYIKDESIDLCYIDPPFNSKRNYNQIYNNVGKEDKAQAQAFIDTWIWDEAADEGLNQIITNQQNVFTPQSIELIVGLSKVLKKGSLLAYLVSMTLRIAEIYRVLKPTGSFYFHCDPTASHYLKIIIDAVFCGHSGEYRNEIIWKRTNAKGLAFTRFASNHDVVFYYSKTKDFKWNAQYKPHDEKYLEDFYKYVEEGTGRRYRLGDLTNPNKNRPNLTYEFLGVKRVWRWTKERMEQAYKDGIVIQTKPGGVPSLKRYLDEQEGTPIDDVWNDIMPIQAQSNESLGYPTQKPVDLLDRIIQASSNEGDTILDCYCGCGTTIASAQHLKRNWIGVDITYQSISLILKRMEETYGKPILKTIELNGVPEDMNSAIALANKSDDRTRKEFEKWVILTYSNNRAIINEKKGSDKGIDGITYTMDSKQDLKQIIFSVKSGHVGSAQIRDLIGTIDREKAAAGIFITLEKPTKDMLQEAKSAGTYTNDLLPKPIEKIKIVTVEEILAGERMNLPLTMEVLKKAQQKIASNQAKLDLE